MVRSSSMLQRALLILALTSSALLCVRADGPLEGLDDAPTERSAPAATHIPSDRQAAGAKITTTQSGEATLESLGLSSEAQAEVERLRSTAARAGAVFSPFGVFEFGKQELAACAVLIFFLINMAWGRKVNTKLAMSWAEAFAKPDGILDKNFALIDSGEKGSKLMREAGNCFKFYASGRRHVEGLLATLNLRARQDILAMMWYLINPIEDTVTLEAFMTEASMPALVIAIGTPKVLRRMAQEQLDLDKFTKKMQAPRDLMPNWPHEKLHIHAEHSSLFTDLFNDPRLLNTLSFTGPHAKALKYLRSMHFTNDSHEGSHKRVLRFTFALPAASAMADLAPLMALVPLCIDLVGAYKVAPDLKARTEASRTKASEKASKDSRNARIEALATRKQDKALEEKAKLMRMAPDDRARAEEKLRKKQMEKMQRKRTKTG